MTNIQQPRMWSDAVRALPFSTWAIWLVPILTLALAYDQYGAQFTTTRDDLQETTARLDKAVSLAQLAPRYREKLAAASTQLNALLPRTYQAESVGASQSAMVQELTELLNAIYVQADSPPQVRTEPLSEHVEVLTAEVQFNAVPQQLHGLELQLLARQGKFSLTELRAQVIPDPARNSQQLQVSMVVKAIHLNATMATHLASNHAANP